MLEQVDGIWRLKEDSAADLPVVQVTWYGAQAYCEWRMLRLPYEADYELAASADGQLTYPWGESSPSCTEAVFADCNLQQPAIVCDHLAGNSQEGICDLAGKQNVQQYMYAPSEGEYISMGADLDEAIHLFIMGQHQSLLVTSGEDITGVLRLTDVFAAVYHVMKECFS